MRHVVNALYGRLLPARGVPACGPDRGRRFDKETRHTREDVPWEVNNCLSRVTYFPSSALAVSTAAEALGE